MDHRVKLAIVMALGLAPLAACTPDTPETQIGWDVNDHMSRDAYRGDDYRAPPPPITREAGAKTYIYDGDNYTPPPRYTQRTAVNAPRPTPRPAYYDERKYDDRKYDDRRYDDRTDSNGSFLWPARGRVISTFGSNSNGERNDGINIALPAGAPIKAAAGGTVSYSGDGLKDYGNLLLIKHSDGYVTAYAHAERLLVRQGDVVRPGQVIAYAGHTGDVATPQLHFEIRHGTTPVNPDRLLAERNS